MDLGTETHRNENAALDKGRNSKKTPQPPEKKFNLSKRLNKKQINTLDHVVYHTHTLWGKRIE